MGRNAAACVLATLLAIAGGCAGNAEVNEAGFRARQAQKPLSIPLSPIAASNDYLLGTRDVIQVRIFELEAPGVLSTFEVEVDSNGAVPIPYVGPLPAAGLTTAAFRKSVEQKLAASYLVEPQVIVSVKEYRSREVGVIGAVEKPGLYYLNRNRVTLVEALSLAGGLTDKAGTRAFVLTPRSKKRAPGAAELEHVEVDLVALLDNGRIAADVLVEPGSIVQIPLAEEFFVSGYVQKGGGFPYRRPTTVLQAVAIAGGLDPWRASPSKVVVKRMPPGASTPAVIEVDVGRIAAGKDPDVAILPGDTVSCERTIPWAIWTTLLDSVRGVFGFGFSLGSI